jgi:hypothetical protein
MLLYIATKPYNMHVRGLIAVLFLLLSVFSAGNAYSAETAEGVKLEFTAEIHVLPESEDTQTGITLTGELYWQEPLLRADVIEPLTAETILLLLNFETKDIVVLYPDTLNGYKANLAGSDQAEHIACLRWLLGGKKSPDLLEWNYQDLGTTEIDSTIGRHYRLTESENVYLDWWADDEGKPLQVEVTYHGITAAGCVESYELLERVPDNLFAFDEDEYEITEFEPSVDQPLPEL